jgi:hypothetical protein
LVLHQNRWRSENGRFDQPLSVSSGSLRQHSFFSVAL